MLSNSLLNRNYIKKNIWGGTSQRLAIYLRHVYHLLCANYFFMCFININFLVSITTQRYLLFFLLHGEETKALSVW